MKPLKRDFKALQREFKVLTGRGMKEWEAMRVLGLPHKPRGWKR